MTAEPAVQIAAATRVVAAEAVTKVYPMPGAPVEALRGVTLAVERGTLLSIAGPSGCGKSTLLHLLGGVDRPTTGSVTILGHRTDGLGDAALARIRLRHVGFVFQRFFLLPMLTAEENVALPMMEARVPADERRRRVRALLERVGLGARMRYRPGQLSGGEMQRVASWPTSPPANWTRRRGGKSAACSGLSAGTGSPSSW